MKKLLMTGIVFAAMIIFGTFSVYAQTQYTVNDTVSAVLDDEGTLTVSGTGEIDSSPWYQSDSYKIKKLVISNGITAIGDGAFYGCNYIADVYVGNSVKTIGAGAFATENTNRLASITGMAGVTAFGNFAFQNSVFTSFTFPDATKTIGDSLFSGCSKLTTINIPASVTQIGTVGHFCSSLQTVNVNSGNKNYKSIDGVLFDKNATELVTFPSARTGSYSIPASVTTLNAYSFSLSKLTSVTIPDTVKKLYDGVFYKSSLTSLNIPDSVDYLGYFLIEGNEALESVTIGTGIETLSYRGFNGCTSLKTVSLGKNVKDLETLTFVGCTSLTSINIPQGVTEIGGSVFYNCSSLSSINLPNGLKTIKGMAFLNTGLTSVTIPDSVTYIAYNAFPEDANLTVPSGLKKQKDGSYLAVKLIPVDVSRYYDLAYQVLNLVNEERAKEGVSPLKMDKELLDAAMLRAAETSIYWDHTRPTELPCFTASSKMNRENIAAGSRTAAGVMNQWMNSPGHRANILSEDSTGIGIGVVMVDGTYYWVQCFTGSSVTEAKQSSYTNNTATVQVETKLGMDEWYPFAYPESAELNKGETASTTMRIFNSWVSTAINPSYLGFASSDTSICKVSSKGVITAVGSGSATVTVYIKNEPDVKAYMTVNVKLSTPEVSLANSSKGIVVKWNKENDAEGYIVYKKTHDTQWKEITKITSNSVLTYTDTTVENDSGTVYYYTVRAYKGSSKSDFDGNVCIMRLQAPELTLSNDVNGVKIKWTDVNGADGYYVYRQLESGKWKRLHEASSNSLYYVDESIADQSGEVFYYSVKAYYDNDLGDYLTDVKIKWLTAPTFKLTNKTSGINVKWNEVAGANRYDVYRKQDGGKWEKIHEAAESDRSYTDASAASDYGKTFYYTVRAASDKDISGFISDSTILRLETPGVTLTDKASGIVIKWNKIDSADGYYVYRSLDGSKWDKLTDASGETFSYTDKTAVNKSGEVFYYTVTAHSAKYTSDYVKNVKIKRLDPPTVSLSNASSGVNVKWSKVNGADKYYIYKKPENGKWEQIADADANTVLYTDKTVGSSSGEVFYYTVKASSGEYTGDFVSNVNIKRLSTPKVTLSNAASGVTVKWDAVKGSGGYLVYRKQSGGKWEKIADLASNKLAYTDKSVKKLSGQVFYYTVKAYSDKFTSDIVSNAKIRWLLAPTTKTANATAGISVNWNKISGAEGYYVYRKEKGGSWSKVATIKKASTIKYTDKNTEAGKYYYYKVKAYTGDSTSNSVESNALRRLTTPNVNLKNTTSGIKVSWNKVKGAAGYYVYRKTANGSWQKIATLSGTAYTDKSVKKNKGTVYYYTVKAYCKSWVSDFVTNAKIKRA